MQMPSDQPRRTFHVADHGSVIGTRRKAQRIAAHITDLTSGGGNWDIDFSKVEVCAPNAAQEIVRAVAPLRERAIYTCMNMDVAAAFDVAEQWLRENEAGG